MVLGLSLKLAAGSCAKLILSDTLRLLHGSTLTVDCFTAARLDCFTASIFQREKGVEVGMGTLTLRLAFRLILRHHGWHAYRLLISGQYVTWRGASCLGGGVVVARSSG